jgi:phospholipid/cholesterol/gamma-HCH transport system substrate-binding protein
VTVYRSLIKIIVFIVVTSVLTLVLAATIANVAVSNTRTYHAMFADVTGLNSGDDVRIAGVRVGQVKSVKVSSKRYADVTFGVKKNIALQTTTKAAVRYLNLVGQRYLALTEGASVGETLRANQVIPLQQTTPPLDLTVLFNGFKPLFRALTPQDVNQLSYEVIQVLQGEGGTVDDLLAHTAALTSTLAQRDQVIGDVVTHLNAVLTQVNTHDDQLSSLVATTQQLVSGLAADRGSIGDAISGLSGLADATTRLLQQGRQPLRDDITQLGGVAANLAANSGLVEQFLVTLPTKLDALGRTASYGSWLNFYLCSATTDAPAPPGGATPGIPVTAGRCR